MRPAAVSWGIAEPEVVREWIINVRAHPDLTPVLAKYAFFGHLAHRHQFDLRLILMGNHDFFALFCYADQFENLSGFAIRSIPAR